MAVCSTWEQQKCGFSFPSVVAQASQARASGFLWEQSRAGVTTGHALQNLEFFFFPSKDKRCSHLKLGFEPRERRWVQILSLQLSKDEVWSCFKWHQNSKLTLRWCDLLSGLRLGVTKGFSCGQAVKGLPRGDRATFAVWWGTKKIWWVPQSSTS